MSDGWRVLITGIGGVLAAELARRLSVVDGVDLIVGVDTRLPNHDLQRTRIVRAELSSPVVGELFERERIDTLVHLAISATPGPDRTRSRKERNVIDTMQLLAAAQRATHLRSVILKSTTAVYGSDAANRSLFAEDVTAHADRGYAKDVIEVEGYARALARRREDLVVTVLRFADLLGHGIDTPFGRYLAMPVIPTVLGYDPRLQLCHTSDAVEVLVRSCLDTRPGIFNVAGPGVLYLSQAARIAGRPTVPVPLPLVDALAEVVRRAAIVDVPTDQLHYLSYGRVADIDRLRERFGYEPRYSTRATLEAHLAEQGVARVIDDRGLRWLERRAVDLVRSLPGGRSA